MNDSVEKNYDIFLSYSICDYEQAVIVYNHLRLKFKHLEVCLDIEQEPNSIFDLRYIRHFKSAKLVICILSKSYALTFQLLNNESDFLQAFKIKKEIIFLNYENILKKSIFDNKIRFNFYSFNNEWSYEILEMFLDMIKTNWPEVLVNSNNKSIEFKEGDETHDDLNTNHAYHNILQKNQSVLVDSIELRGNRKKSEYFTIEEINNALKYDSTIKKDNMSTNLTFNEDINGKVRKKSVKYEKEQNNRDKLQLNNENLVQSNHANEVEFLQSNVSNSQVQPNINLENHGKTYETHKLKEKKNSSNSIKILEDSPKTISQLWASTVSLIIYKQELKKHNFDYES